MTSQTIAQPGVQLGREIDALLEVDAPHSRIIFVSAFVALRTILRLRERLLARFEDGCRLRLVVGIDLGGTSREVLEELLRWNCETFVFHNTISRATFHPKIYLLETPTSATLFVGSNNLTDGGFYTNYEAATRYDFDLPADTIEYGRLLGPLTPFLQPEGATVRRLNADLIHTLIARGELPTEAEARQRSRNRTRPPAPGNAPIPASPFAAVAIPLPPLLPQNVREEEPPEPQLQQPQEEGPAPALTAPPQGVLVWRKTLPRTDALKVHAGKKGAPTAPSP